ncbi:MAG: hypothetical protein V4543_01870 [Bacteroidota bacterium]
MKKPAIVLLLLFCCLRLYAQKTEFSKEDSEVINQKFLVPNAEIFEAHVISHESYYDKSGTYGIVTVQVLKSFSQGIECGEYKFRTEAVGGILHDLVTGKVSHMDAEHSSPMFGNLLLSCIKLKDNTLSLNARFMYDPNGKNAAYLLIDNQVKAQIDDYRNIYPLLPQSKVCSEIKQGRGR